MRDSSITLADGRSLAYIEIGARGGPGRDVLPWRSKQPLGGGNVEDAFAGLDVRVVFPDRPGYGGSSSQPGRHREDWPSDVAALADRLGVERFAVMGVSGVGPTLWPVRRCCRTESAAQALCVG
jgi:pimeloyl-ACP methyl ester carboxylesterase